MSKKQIANDHGPRIELAESIPAGTDALVLGLIAAAEDDDSPTLLLPEDLLDDAAAEGISSALAAIGATGSAGEVRRIPAPAGVSATTVVTVGIGKAADLDDPEQIRRAAGVVARELDGVTSAATTLSTADVAATVEGLILGAYRFDDFRSERTAPKKAAVEAVTLIVDRKPGKARKQAERAAVVADAVALARDFVNTPPSHLYPAEFAERSRKLAREVGLTVEVLDEKELAKQGYGGIVGVGQGSNRPPRLVRLTHTGKSKAAKVALVGKGITFDTGGISIKPAANMDQMTSDMGGAAAVIATMIAVARLDLDVSVTATVPMAENMPSSTAQRPGDVLTQYGGTTVEVLNTDAEGRLILADAIVRACEDAPDYLIDTATLTGAQMVALGTRTPGVMGTEEFRDRVARCSADTGENAWAMPLPEELRDDLKSRVADLANITPHRWGGMLAAGVYLREFVAGDVAWAHIDIAGPAFNSGSPWGYTTKGGTGVPVRTMLAVLEDIEADG